jgi:hypothetical protein
MLYWSRVNSCLAGHELQHKKLMAAHAESSRSINVFYLVPHATTTFAFSAGTLGLITASIAHIDWSSGERAEWFRSGKNPEVNPSYLSWSLLISVAVFYPATHNHKELQ